MARGTLHAPKPEGQRRNHHRPTHDYRDVERDGEIRGPELSGNWDQSVRDWYEVWRRAPQAALFEETDWMRLQTLAHIVQAYHRRPSAAALSEIRMNEERLGATITDRMRARINIVEDEPPALAEVKPISSRERFSKRLDPGS